PIALISFFIFFHILGTSLEEYDRAKSRAKEQSVPEEAPVETNTEEPVESDAPQSPDVVTVEQVVETTLTEETQGIDRKILIRIAVIVAVILAMIFVSVYASYELVTVKPPKRDVPLKWIVIAACLIITLIKNLAAIYNFLIPYNCRLAMYTGGVGAYIWVYYAYLVYYVARVAKSSGTEEDVMINTFKEMIVFSCGMICGYIFLHFAYSDLWQRETQRSAEMKARKEHNAIENTDARPLLTDEQ
ncbi:hypothetical protein PMAYCL1PPCAC_20292, partial [Pristionchus mayeri]